MSFMNSIKYKRKIFLIISCICILIIIGCSNFNTPTESAAVIKNEENKLAFVTGDWYPIGGTDKYFSEIVADGPIPWAINTNGNLCKLIDGQWINLGGIVSNLCVSNEVAYVIATDNCVFKNMNYVWSRVGTTENRLKEICLDNDNLWGVGLNGVVYSFSNGLWTHYGGIGSNLCVSNNILYIIGQDKTVYKSIAQGSWIRLGSFEAKEIFAEDGNVWAIDTDGEIYRWNGTSWVFLGYPTLFFGPAKCLNVSAETPYVISETYDAPLMYVPENLWTYLNSKANKVIDLYVEDGKPWAIGINGNAFEYR